jgi:anti-sigma28 factor (negative regulator of flagellin synthesis)
MPSCKICRGIVFDGIHLSDGGLLHKSCLESIQGKDLKIRYKIYEQQGRLSKLRREFERRKKLIFKIVSIFSKPDVDIVDIERKISILEKNIEQLFENLHPLQTKTATLYDYFLTYPPDWEARRKQIVEREGNKCSDCGNWRHLHLHHLKPLSKGGSNKISNLELLCEKCHSKKHGGRNFSGDLNSSETAFSKRVANIRYAIANGKLIKFGYKKYKDKSYKQRTVKPAKLVILDHIRNTGSTLCVHGYCELRKARRTFALKRMRGLKVENRIQGFKPNSKSSSDTNKFKKPTSTKKMAKPKKKPTPTKKLVKLKKKTQFEDMCDQLEQHDIENLKLME